MINEKKKNKSTVHNRNCIALRIIDLYECDNVYLWTVPERLQRQETKERSERVRRWMDETNSKYVPK